MSRVVRLRITDPAELAPFRSHGPPGPLLSGVVFHGMDYGPSFEAAQSLLLRGIETPYSTPTAMALCIARSFGFRSLLPDRAVRPACPVINAFRVPAGFPTLLIYSTPLRPYSAQRG